MNICLEVTGRALTVSQAAVTALCPLWTSWVFSVCIRSMALHHAGLEVFTIGLQSRSRFRSEGVLSRHRTIALLCKSSGQLVNLCFPRLQTGDAVLRALGLLVAIGPELTHRAHVCEFDGSNKAHSESMDCSKESSAEVGRVEHGLSGWGVCVNCHERRTLQESFIIR